MSWYDYVPVVGPIAEAAQGNWGKAGTEALAQGAGFAVGGPVGLGVGSIAGGMGAGGIDAIHGANQKRTQGFYDAANAASALGDSQKAFQMQGLDKAEGYYGGARARLNAAYGPPGTPPSGDGYYGR